MEVGEEREYTLSLHCHHQNDSCIQMGSDESHFNASLIVRDSHKIVSTDNFWRERRAEADSNRGPSAYQPNVLPLAQTGLPRPFPHPQTPPPPHHHQRRLYATIIPIRGRWHRRESMNCVKEERSRFVFVFYASGSCFFILQLWAILRFFVCFCFSVYHSARVD